MAEWLRDNWFYAVAFVGACVVAFFAFRAAAKASAQHKKNYKAEEEYIKRLKALKEKYVPLKKQTIENAPDDELLEGTALGIQLFLQKQEDMEKEFLSLSDEKKLIYTLDVFLSDKTLNSFFRSNTEILKSRLVPALSLVGLSEDAERILPVAKMFDDNDEDTSLDEKRVSQLDEQLETDGFLSSVKLAAAKYIKENAEVFVNGE